MKKVLRVLMALALLLVCSVPLGAEAASFGERVEGMAEVTGVRISTHDGMTRIVVDADKPVKIKTMTLANPTRVVADIQGAWLSGKVKRDTSVSGPFASRVRIAQFSKNVVRVVVETNVGKNNYRVFTLSGGPVPGRVVLDFGQADAASDKADNTASNETGRDEAVHDAGDEADRDKACDAAADEHDKTVETADEARHETAEDGSGEDGGRDGWKCRAGQDGDRARH